MKLSKRQYKFLKIAAEHHGFWTAAVARVKERLQDGYAHCALDFSDLIIKMEAEVA